MADPVPGEIIAARSKILHRLADQKKREFYEGQQGRILRVLFEERNGDGWFVGFSDNYVKVGVATNRDLSNRFGFVRVDGVVGRGRHRQPLAHGELVELEDEATRVDAQAWAGESRSVLP
jgi:tRNA A37 methylthiotransferase MiaB